MFTRSQLVYLNNKGIKTSEAKRQLELLKKGEAFVRLVKPALLNGGIVNIRKKKEKYLQEYTALAKNKKILKFVPASGAASRMFNMLNDVYLDPNIVDTNKCYKNYIADFISCLNSFAFNQHISNKDDLQEILKELLTKNGYNYLEMPKGLIEFHKYYRETRTAFEEQLIESLEYLKDKNKVCRFHFTILPQHRRLFEAEQRKIRRKLEKRFKVRIDITYSLQSHRTDTVASTLDGKLFIDEQGKLVLRPAGHGALLNNLNKLNNVDVVLIKNIDNVAHDWLKPVVIEEEKILLGYFAEIQQKIFNYQLQIKAKTAAIKEVKEFLIKTLNIKGPILKNFELKKAAEILNRPFRVCGMVKNEGEPGGGPFWVKNRQGNITLQIVEKDQISPAQKLSIYKKSSHFNPVNIICGIKDHQGKKYDLSKYCDDDAVIITRKNKNGRTLKALELPGLWNGGMAYWNTIFVEVPLNTFTPVKTVNDLLRPEHQPED